MGGAGGSRRDWGLGIWGWALCGLVGKFGELPAKMPHVSEFTRYWFKSASEENREEKTASLWGLGGVIDGDASVMQGIFSCKIHGGESLIPVMNRFGSFGVPDQCVIAPPTPVLQFMKLHLDLNAFVTALNHDNLLWSKSVLRRRDRIKGRCFQNPDRRAGRHGSSDRALPGDLGRPKIGGPTRRHVRVNKLRRGADGKYRGFV